MCGEITTKPPKMKLWPQSHLSAVVKHQRSKNELVRLMYRDAFRVLSIITAQHGPAGL